MGKDLKQVTEAKAKKAVAAAQHKFNEVKKDMDAHIKKEPEKAVLLAAAVGAALGAVSVYLLTKKKKE